jgi:DNA polymerase III epsilon subunit-like protein
MIYLVLYIALIIVIIIIVASTGKSKKETSNSTPAVSEKETQQLVTQTNEFENSEKVTGKYIIVDTETTGLPGSKYNPIEDSSNWPYILQIAWIVLDEEFKIITSSKHYLDYKGEIPYAATRVHHIDKAMIRKLGEPTSIVLRKFIKDTQLAEFIVAHNIDFDIPIIRAELYRNGIFNSIELMPTICTMLQSKHFVEATNSRGSIKNPKLEELYLKCFFGSIYAGTVQNNHDAMVDASMTAKCFQYLVEHEILDSSGKIPKKKKVVPKRKPKSTENIKTKTVLPPKFETNEKHIFYKKGIVITGLFNDFPDIAVLHEILIDLGAVIQEYPDDNTDVLIAGESPDDDQIEIVMQNRSIGIRTAIIDEAALFKILN